MFRLRQKHSKPSAEAGQPVDANGLIDAQDPGRAVVAALGVALLLNLAWLWLSDLTGSFFHVFSIAQGPLIGFAVQRAGRGIDWRFPVIAAATALLAAFSGNFIVSLANTAAILDVSPLQVLRGLTVWTWQTWYAEVLTAADLIYGLFAAFVAAFYSKRRLRREEVFAMKQGIRR